MDLWRQYIKERLGHDMVESDHAFISYCITGPVCSIEDAFCEPDFRRTQEATKLMDEIVAISREMSCQRILAQVWPGTPGADGALWGLMKYGFKLVPSEGGRVFLSLEIGGERGKR